MNVLFLGSVAMVIGITLGLESTQNQTQELRGNHICTKIVKYETIEAYYERQKCGPTEIASADLLNTKEKCGPKHKIVKKYRKVYRYKKVYVCCPGYVSIWYKCVKAKTTERQPTPTTTPTSQTTTPTTTPTSVTTPTTTTNVTTMPNVTATPMPKDDKCVPVIIIVLIVITVIVVVLSCLLCIVCCCNIQERKKKCKCYGKDIDEKVPIKKAASDNERTYNHYDSCVLPGDKQQHYDNNTYQQQNADNYEDLHRYGNTQNGQLENTYTTGKH